MAGLLAGNMLRRHDVEILERNPSLPDNHTAVLRFRTTEVSDAAGIPFDEVMVEKCFWDGRRIRSSITLAEANLYSLIVTGEVYPRSIQNLHKDVRHIAPQDFVAQMAKNLNIRFGQNIDRPRRDNPVISTVPMPIMMKMVGWEDIPTFSYSPIWTVRCKIVVPSCHIYQTIYNCTSGEWYRATIQRDLLILEFMFEPVGPLLERYCNDAIARAFGLDLHGHGIIPTITQCSMSKQSFGKISPIDESLRRRFMLHLTDKWNIYSLGRFATWRGVLLDDLVKDIKQIERMMHSQNNYTQRLVATKP